MTASYLTTDIIVIIVLVVVLVLVGVCAFLIHFYWTKIGVAEIWNTVKWSSMRSSFYRTMRRFSLSSTNKPASERPFSSVSVYSDDVYDITAPVPASTENRKSIPVSSYYITPPTVSSSNHNQRQNLRIPVSTLASNNSVSPSYPPKTEQPMASRIIRNIPQHDNQYNDPSSIIQKQRF